MLSEASHKSKLKFLSPMYIYTHSLMYVMTVQYSRPETQRQNDFTTIGFLSLFAKHTIAYCVSFTDFDSSLFW